MAGGICVMPITGCVRGPKLNQRVVNEEKWTGFTRLKMVGSKHQGLSILNPVRAFIKEKEDVMSNNNGNHNGNSNGKQLLRPAIVIGAGGTGNQVVRRLKRLIQQHYGDTPTLLHFMVIDTDAATFNDQ